MKQRKVRLLSNGKSNHNNNNNNNVNNSKNAGVSCMRQRLRKIGNNNKNNRRGSEKSCVKFKRFHRDDDDVVKKDLMKEVCFGEFTREVYNAICVRLGDTLHIPEDSVQALFNDMQLFPSKTQVSKMLQCARQCGKRNGATDYITFGEFCFLVREMQNQTPRHQQQQQQQNNNRHNSQYSLTTNTQQQQQQQQSVQTNSSIVECSSRCDVFLGGSCNPTTWRTDTAIPELQKHGITFYNPQVKMWGPELVAQEYDAKQAASVLLFVIDSQTRSTVGMIEVAYLVASGRCVVIVAEPFTRGQTIMGEPISDKEYLDLVESQKTLLDLVKSRGVRIHTNLTTALQCTANILRNTTNGISAEEQITYKLRRLREVYDSYGGEMRLRNVLEAYEKLTNKSLEITKLYGYLNGGNGTATNTTINGVNSTISFERFCALMAEFSTSKGCNMCTTDVWMKQPFQPTTYSNLNDTKTNCLIEKSLPLPQSTNNYYEHNNTKGIYLGGSLSTKMKWRDEIAIPLIKKHGLAYYNPALREGNNDDDDDNEEIDGKNWMKKIDVLEWKTIMDNSRVLLMVVTNDTRSMTSIILAAYFIGLNKNIVLCVKNLPSADDDDKCVIKEETLTSNAVKDYNRARVYLRDLAARKQVPVFEDVAEAVECAIEKCKTR